MCRVKNCPRPGGEYYHADLIGLAAVSTDGDQLGRVVAVHNFGAGDLIEIAPPKGATLLLPFTETVVPEVDLAAGRVVIDLPGEIEGDTPDTLERWIIVRVFTSSPDLIRRSIPRYGGQNHVARDGPNPVSRHVSRPARRQPRRARAGDRPLANGGTGHP